MPVPEAKRALPESTSMLDAFQIPSRDHFTVGKTIDAVRRAPFEKAARAAGDFFTSGVAYLANRGHDPFIQEVGTVTWWTVNQRRVLTAYTEDMKGAAMQLGVPPEIALTAYSKNDEPHVVFTARKSGLLIPEAAYVLLPPEFVVNAQTQPVETLATMAWIGSQVRDMANGRLLLDPKYLNHRANATEAHFLKQAVAEHPDVELSQNSQALLEAFPDGIFSSRVSPAAIYKGITGTEFQQAPNN